jgi:hypothetical protein
VSCTIRPFGGSDHESSAKLDMGVRNLHGITLAGFVNLFVSHGFDVPEEEIKVHFSRFDSSGDGVIDENEFESLCTSTSLRESFSSMTPSNFESTREKWAKTPAPSSPSAKAPAPSPPSIQDGIEVIRLGKDHSAAGACPQELQQRDSKQVVKDMESEVKDTWQMMYCGGAVPVVTALKKVRDKYKIKLEVESFDW